MKYRVLIQPTAKAELREAYRWYSNESPAAASRWLDNLVATIDTLKTYPERCAFAPEN
jgi:plasmid stabilization system protein ParE